jgi:uncharacterized protein (DUF1501 family)
MGKSITINIKNPGEHNTSGDFFVRGFYYSGGKVPQFPDISKVYAGFTSSDAAGFALILAAIAFALLIRQPFGVPPSITTWVY